MTLLLHQIRKELVQHATLAALWLGVVIVLTMRGAGRTTEVFSNNGYQFSSHSSINLLLSAGLILPLLVGLADSPSNSNGFIQTRPVGFGIIWAAKLIVIVAIIVTPLMLASLTVSLIHGGSLGLAAGGMLDQFLLLTPIVSFFLFWAGLSRDGRHLGRILLGGAVVAILCLALTLGGMGWLNEPLLERIMEEPGSLAARYLLLAWGAAFMAAGGVFWQAHAPGKTGLPWRLALIIGLIGAITFTLPGLNFLQPDPTPPPGVAKALNEASVEIDPYQIRVLLGMDGGSGSRTETLTVESGLRVTSLPNNLVIFPVATGATLTDGEDLAAPSQQQRRSEFRGFHLASGTPREALLRLLDGEFTVFAPQSGSAFKERLWATRKWAMTETLRRHFDEPLDLLYQFDMACAEIRELADLPFRDGATVSSQNFTATLMLPPAMLDESFTFALRTRFPERLFTRRQDLRKRNASSLRHYYFALVTNREREEALLANVRTVGTARGHLSGYPEKLMLFDFRHSSEFSGSLDNAFFENARLHLFRFDWKGIVTDTARKSNLTLRHHLHPTAHPPGPRMDAVAYRAALNALEPLAEEPDESDVSALVRIIDDTEHWQIDEGDSAYQRLMAIAEKNLELLFEVLQHAEQGSERALLDIIDTVITPDHLNLLIEFLPRHPELASILVRRGWESDARETLVSMLAERRILPSSALRAIALLRDPGTYPLLLEQFAHHRQSSTYDMLWAIEELRPRLEALAREKWQEDQALFNHHLDLGLRAGELRALSMAFRYTKANSRNLPLVRTLRPVLLLPRDWEEAAESLTKFSADDFEFDPDLRLFRQKEVP